MTKEILTTESSNNDNEDAELEIVNNEIQTDIGSQDIKTVDSNIELQKIETKSEVLNDENKDNIVESEEDNSEIDKNDENDEDKNNEILKESNQIEENENDVNLINNKESISTKEEEELKYQEIMINEELIPQLRFTSHPISLNVKTSKIKLVDLQHKYLNYKDISIAKDGFIPNSEIRRILNKPFDDMPFKTRTKELTKEEEAKKRLEAILLNYLPEDLIIEVPETNLKEMQEKAKLAATTQKRLPSMNLDDQDDLNKELADQIGVEDELDGMIQNISMKTSKSKRKKYARQITKAAVINQLEKKAKEKEERLREKLLREGQENDENVESKEVVIVTPEKSIDLDLLDKIDAKIEQDKITELKAKEERRKAESMLSKQTPDELIELLFKTYGKNETYQIFYDAIKGDKDSIAKIETTLLNELNRRTVLSTITDVNHAFRYVAYHIGAESEVVRTALMVDNSTFGSKNELELLESKISDILGNQIKMAKFLSSLSTTLVSVSEKFKKFEKKESFQLILDAFNKKSEPLNKLEVLLGNIITIDDFLELIRNCKDSEIQRLSLVIEKSDKSIRKSKTSKRKSGSDPSDFVPNLTDDQKKLLPSLPNLNDPIQSKKIAERLAKGLQSQTVKVIFSDASKIEGTKIDFSKDSLKESLNEQLLRKAGLKDKMSRKQKKETEKPIQEETDYDPLPTIKPEKSLDKPESVHLYSEAKLKSSDLFKNYYERLIQNDWWPKDIRTDIAEDEVMMVFIKILPILFKISHHMDAAKYIMEFKRLFTIKKSTKAFVIEMLYSYLAFDGEKIKQAQDTNNLQAHAYYSKRVAILFKLLKHFEEEIEEVEEEFFVRFGKISVKKTSPKMKKTKGKSLKEKNYSTVIQNILNVETNLIQQTPEIEVNNFLDIMKNSKDETDYKIAALGLKNLLEHQQDTKLTSQVEKELSRQLSDSSRKLADAAVSENKQKSEVYYERVKKSSQILKIVFGQEKTDKPEEFPTLENIVNNIEKFKEEPAKFLQTPIFKTSEKEEKVFEKTIEGRKISDPQVKETKVQLEDDTNKQKVSLPKSDKEPISKTSKISKEVTKETIVEKEQKLSDLKPTVTPAISSNIKDSKISQSTKLDTHETDVAKPIKSQTTVHHEKSKIKSQIEEPVPKIAVDDKSTVNINDDKNIGVSIIDSKDVYETKADTKNVDKTKIDKGKIDEVKVDEVKVDEVKVDEVKVDEVKVDEVKVDEVKVDEVKVDDVKVDEVKLDEVKVDEVKVDETKIDQKDNNEKETVKTKEQILEENIKDLPKSSLKTAKELQSESIAEKDKAITKTAKIKEAQLKHSKIDEKKDLSQQVENISSYIGNQINIKFSEHEDSLGEKILGKTLSSDANLKELSAALNIDKKTQKLMDNLIDDIQKQIELNLTTTVASSEKGSIGSANIPLTQVAHLILKEIIDTIEATLTDLTDIEHCKAISRILTNNTVSSQLENVGLETMSKEISEHFIKKSSLVENTKAIIEQSLSETVEQLFVNVAQNEEVTKIVQKSTVQTIGGMTNLLRFLNDETENVGKTIQNLLTTAVENIEIPDHKHLNSPTETNIRDTPKTYKMLKKKARKAIPILKSFKPEIDKLQIARNRIRKQLEEFNVKLLSEIDNADKVIDHLLYERDKNVKDPDTVIKLSQALFAVVQDLEERDKMELMEIIAGNTFANLIKDMQNLLSHSLKQYDVPTALIRSTTNILLLQNLGVFGLEDFQEALEKYKSKYPDEVSFTKNPLTLGLLSDGQKLNISKYDLNIDPKLTFLRDVSALRPVDRAKGLEMGLIEKFTDELEEDAEVESVLTHDTEGVDENLPIMFNVISSIKYKMCKDYKNNCEIKRDLLDIDHLMDQYKSGLLTQSDEENSFINIVREEGPGTKSKLMQLAEDNKAIKTVANIGGMLKLPLTPEGKKMKLKPDHQLKKSILKNKNKNKTNKLPYLVDKEKINKNAHFTADINQKSAIDDLRSRLKDEIYKEYPSLSKVIDLDDFKVSTVDNDLEQTNQFRKLYGRYATFLPFIGKSKSLISSLLDQGLRIMHFNLGPGTLIKAILKSEKRKTLKQLSDHFDDSEIKDEKESFKKLITPNQLLHCHMTPRPNIIPIHEWSKVSMAGTRQNLRPKIIHSDNKSHCNHHILAKKFLHRHGISISNHLERYETLEIINKTIQENSYLRVQNSLLRCLIRVLEDK